MENYTGLTILLNKTKNAEKRVDDLTLLLFKNDIIASRDEFPIGTPKEYKQFIVKNTNHNDKEYIEIIVPMKKDAFKEKIKNFFKEDLNTFVVRKGTKDIQFKDVVKQIVINTDHINAINL